ncbi:MAG TPA: hypothetical protein ENI99_10635 [Sedimenticola sp.]|nr:hypothetical protein [Sedimenticola sp.]
MNTVPLLQGAAAAAYLGAAGLLGAGSRRRRLAAAGVVLAAGGFCVHLFVLVWRWLEIGKLPIVTRYEDMTVDALAVAGVYLLAQWRRPLLRPAGIGVLPLAAAALSAALWYNLGSFPWTPALRTNWLVIHSQLNSLAIGIATLTAAASLLPQGDEKTRIVGRLLAWTFFLWTAMVAAGSYWASLAWGRYWGWDPIESWSLVTLLGYAFVLHLRLKPAWRGRGGDLLGLVPYAMMLFTTYGLLLVMRSVHGRYLFL